MAPTQQQALNSKLKSVSSGSRPKARVLRYLKKQAPQVKESGRRVLLLKGIRCSESMSTILKDLRVTKAPESKMMGRNNMIAPFQDESAVSLEFLCTKNDCSLFALASHNKKRPNNLVLGRTFDRRTLDMVELSVVRYKSLGDYPHARKKGVGSKPMMLFVGDKWHLDQDYAKLQNFLLDFYRGELVEKIVLSGLDHLITFTVSDPGKGVENYIVHMRAYFVQLKKDPSGGKSPLPYLTPCGPDMDFLTRRKQWASPDLARLAMKQPKQNKIKKVKNQTTNLFGETIGRLHVEAQDIDKMQGKRVRALRISRKIDADVEKNALEKELEGEKEESAKEFKQDFGFEETSDRK